MKEKSDEKEYQKPTWKEILRDGEISPPDSLWEAIEAQLPEKTSRRILPIWWTSPLFRIASGVFISLGIASALYVWQERDRRTFTSNQQTTTELERVENELPVLPKLAQIEKNTSPSSRTFAQKIDAQQFATNEIPDNENQRQLVSLPFSPAMEIDKEDAFTLTKSTEVLPLDGLRWVDYASRFSQNRRRFLAVPSIESEDKKEEEPVIAQKTWLQVGGGISPFNPQLELADFPSVASMAISNSVIEQASAEMGGNNLGTSGGNPEKSAFEILLNRPSQVFRSGISRQWTGIIGKKIAPRWQVETGIRWMNGRATTSGNVFAFDEATGAIQPFFEASYLAETTDNRTTLSTVLSATEQTDISFTYLAVPVQIGYTVPLAKQWQAILYTGISTDFFRSYGRKLEGEETEKIYQSSNSQFRPVTWSGVAGARIARTFQENWQVTVGVQMQESLTSGLDNSSSATFRPRMFGVQYGLGYVF
ncbi:MAG: outer membrane beta-barrel protein [Spirosomataceae bacterium]